MRAPRRIFMSGTAVAALLTLSACSGSVEPTETAVAPEPATTAATSSSEPTASSLPSAVASGTTSDSASPSASPTTTSTESPTPNSRGDLEKSVGETAGSANLSEPDQDPWLEFQVVDISQATCNSSFPEDPADGNYLLRVDLEVQTTADMRQSFEEEGLWPLSLDFSQDWFAYDSSGTRMNEIDTIAAWSCLDSGHKLPYEIGAAENARGAIVLEVNDVSGEIVHRPWWLGGGWSWQYDISDDV